MLPCNIDMNSIESAYNYIKENQPVLQRQVTLALFNNNVNGSKIVKKLEMRGLIKKSPYKNHKNWCELSLTKKAPTAEDFDARWNDAWRKSICKK